MGTLHEDLVHLRRVTEFFLKWEMFRTKFVQQIEMHFMFSKFFTKIVPLQDNVDKYGSVV
jgi:hypothetical protein